MSDYLQDGESLLCKSLGLLGPHAGKALADPPLQPVRIHVCGRHEPLIPHILPCTGHMTFILYSTCIEPSGSAWSHMLGVPPAPHPARYSG